ncbi:tryptophan 2,3-dioxygenase family protein [Micromonospora sp. WMMD734]|uniref:Tryptophan 2,3-dioxygenase n=1 Tax=Micromonospora humidisoli TaxID=2807622 RepID=A0ABS2JEC3_9ACTN|nr:tryptophan 2,3-dioxygenase family protein [Micromonospora humidisoli]MBM7084882.1 tryptophan 2,3-dioxygenase [Micromonospora humidisoli]
MKRDQSPVLPGDGSTDYARYMRTDELLALQRRPEEVLHRDELLFQVVHQSAELWLKLAGAELTAAVGRTGAADPAGAAALLARATLAVRLVTDQLEMFRHLSPVDFQTMQPALGNGSGAESPGWRQAATVSRQLGRAFAGHLATRGGRLDALAPDDPTRRLATAMIAWDEQVHRWRARHYEVALQVGGHAPGGTPGSAATVLAKLLGHRFFPELHPGRAGVGVPVSAHSGTTEA